jgi:hypothetical protein
MGYMAPAQAFFDMSQEWYGTRMEEDWEPFTTEEAMALWGRHGLTGDFWALD